MPVVARGRRSIAGRYNNSRHRRLGECKLENGTASCRCQLRPGMNARQIHAIAVWVTYCEGFCATAGVINPKTIRLYAKNHEQTGFVAIVLILRTNILILVIVHRVRYISQNNMPLTERPPYQREAGRASIAPAIISRRNSPSMVRLTDFPFFDRSSTLWRSALATMSAT